MDLPFVTDPPPPLRQSWSWSTGMGKDARYHLLHLEPNGLYFRMGLESERECKDLMEKLAQATTAAPLYRHEFLPVDNISELRYSKSMGMLEIYGTAKVPKTVPFPIAEKVYRAVRGAIKKEYRISKGKISSYNANRAPLAAAGLSLATAAMEGVLLSFGLTNIGFAIVASAVCGVFLLGACMLLLYRYINPPKAEILRVTRTIDVPQTSPVAP